ncbi:MAG: LapA family protein [Pseudorhodoplanes sp.]|jgi:uncharacterized integral membrane protein|nr:LapA family protein [Pseudorhodoplanes sp.]
MARKLVIWLVLVPLAIVILMFAVANRQLVTVSFDPFDTVQPAASLTLPLFVLVFILVLLGVIIGGIAAWMRQSRYRRAARVLEGDVAGLRREVALLNDRLAAMQPEGPASNDTARLSYHQPRN